jgi:hypothetical protein
MDMAERCFPYTAGQYCARKIDERRWVDPGLDIYTM